MGERFWNLKNNKALGIDQLPNELFKYERRAQISRIRKFIAAIWDHESIPSRWKEAVIISIFKEGDKLTALNNEVYFQFLLVN